MRKVWFDVDVAEKIGLNEAILLNYFAYWCWKNKQDGKCNQDGKTWMYVTLAELYKMFPFFGERTLQRTIYNLQHEGYIIIQHNAGGMNRTNWYTLTDEGRSLIDMAKSIEKSPSRQNDEMHFANMAYTFRQNDEMHFAKSEFPSNYKKKEEKREKKERSARAKLAPPFDDPPKELIDAWEGFIEMRKAKRNTPTEKAVKLIANKLEKLAPGNDLMKADILNQSTERGWQGVFPLKADYQRTQPKTYGAQQSAAEMYEEVKALMENGGGIL